MPSKIAFYTTRNFLQIPQVQGLDEETIKNN